MRTISAALLCVFLGGCLLPSKTLSPGQREAIQARIAARFANTVLFKPAEAGATDPVAMLLAPLIIQEVADTNASALWQDQFDWADSGPSIRSNLGATIGDGRLHAQVSYSWTYPSGEPPVNSARQQQGVRLTLNAVGEPVIWEVFADSSGADIIYVAQSLELAARAEFGPPLPGRKFSIERSLADSPQTVVANVIDDGPVPMGPVVYLRQGSRDVSALICRCMASQGGMLLGQTNYALQPIVPQDGRPTTYPRAQLEQRLRLPRSF